MHTVVSVERCQHAKPNGCAWRLLACRTFVRHGREHSYIKCGRTRLQNVLAQTNEPTSVSERSSGLDYCSHSVAFEWWVDTHFEIYELPPTMLLMQCKYAYKECFNMRTQKRDGSLHRYCEHHRDKANALQRIYATKRRQELRIAKLQTHIKSKPAPASHKQVARKLVTPVKQEPAIIDEPLAVDEWTPIDLRTEAADQALSDEECAYLRLVLLSV
ncbi:hypothetical protein AeMF1_021531 [Aphanomyces euteiches]|nr:hypothetical protein AeMF1_021531 [Aphanomyces euteiches]KAH9184484.1 hypothetical protein AeNC1_013540 [Aphanomyces euteiches]